MVNSKPPIGDADLELESSSKVPQLVKVIIIQMIQGWIFKLKISPKAKNLVFFLFFCLTINYNKNQFLETRPITLYDHFKVDRSANF
mmetsp:Transcript_5538/g.8707  ORF Transcript_5538/g.8707 Transcript_5538/m.8707 type:complete len:87 (-) Transcript_5538:1718-1978(-)